MALDGADQRLAERRPQRALGAAGPREIVRAGAQLLEVGAGAERAAGAGQHGDLGVGVRLEAAERRRQRMRRLVVERVTRLRPVDDDRGDRSRGVDEDLGRGHFIHLPDRERSLAQIHERARRSRPGRA